jgi:hypothetical protein
MVAMKHRCAGCAKQLGLGTKAVTIWNPWRMWMDVYRVCSSKCRETLTKRLAAEQERRRAVNALYRPPSTR